MSYKDDDNIITPRGVPATATLTFNLDYAYRMSLKDISEMLLQAETEIRDVLTRTSSKFELDRHGSRSERIEFAGAQVTPGRKLWP